MSEKFKKIYNSKIYKVLDIVLAAAAIAAAGAVMLVLFYRQSISDGTTHMSDMGPYIQEMLGTQTKYSFPYPVLFKTGAFFNLFAPTPEWAMVLALTFFNVAAMIITKVILEKQTGARLLSTAATLCLFFLSMIYFRGVSLPGIHYVYSGVFSPNPWHNGTYMAARPFMILAFILGADTLRKYEAGEVKVKEYIAFTIAMLLVTMTKPSYTIVHMAAAGIIMLYRFGRSKGAGFKAMVILGCCYIPTIIDLLYQFAGVFSGSNSVGQEQGIGFSLFKTWSRYATNYPLALILAGAFPILVLILHLGLLKTDSQFRFAWQVYLAGFIMAAILYEKGFREKDFNFAWGYICGLFLVSMVSLIVLLKDTMNIRRKTIIPVAAQWAVLGVHTIMGLRYFAMLTYGGNYM